MGDELQQFTAPNFQAGNLVGCSVTAAALYFVVGTVDSKSALLALTLALAFFGFDFAINLRRGRSLHKYPLNQRAAYILQSGNPYKITFSTILVLTTLYVGLLQVRQQYSDTLFDSGNQLGLGCLFLVALVLFELDSKNRLNPRGTHVDKKIKKLYGSLTNKNGVVMSNVDALCTLLMYTGKFSEAERLSNKVFKMAEESPDLVA